MARPLGWGDLVLFDTPQSGPYILYVSNNRELFFDHNASHPLLESVRKGLAERLLSEEEFFSNPMSVHARGRLGKRVLFELREALCQWFGFRSDEEIVLNSGATEGINSVVRGFVRHRQNLGRRPVLFYSSVEHAAVTGVCEELASQAKVVEIPVDRRGRLDTSFLLSELESTLVDPLADVLLILQLANNEVGTCFDFSFQKELHERFAPRVLTHLPKLKGGKYPKTPQRVWCLLDAAQAVGKLDEAPIRRALHYADYMVFSAHKIGGPMGVGALWVRGGAPYLPLILGGSQEKRRRAGTHNMLGVYGFLLAVRDWLENGPKYRSQMSVLKKELVSGISTVSGISWNSPMSELEGLPNTINFSAADCPDESLLMALDLKKVYVSSGAACNSGSVKPSAILLKMGYSEFEARSSIRVSLGVGTTLSDVQEFVERFRAVVAQVRHAQKVANEFLPPLLGAE